MGGLGISASVLASYLSSCAIDAEPITLVDTFKEEKPRGIKITRIDMPDPEVPVLREEIDAHPFAKFMKNGYNR